MIINDENCIFMEGSIIMFFSMNINTIEYFNMNTSFIIIIFVCLNI